MNRLQMVKLLIEVTGRYDLVADAVGNNYNDAGPIGANLVLNIGARKLDKRSSHVDEDRWYKTELSVREGFQVIPDSRSIKEVWLADGTNILPLTKKTIGWIRDQYDEPVSAQTAETPLYWAPAITRLTDQSNITELGDELITDTGFADVTKWTLALGGSIDTERAALYTDGSTGSALQTLVSPEDETYRITVKSYDRTAGSFTVSINGKDSDAIETNGIHEVELTPTAASPQQIAIGMTADFDGYIDDISVKKIINTYKKDILYDVDDIDLEGIFSRRGIVIRPIPDKEYTISVLGTFYSKSLSADTDENYWSVNAPETLLEGARAVLERFNRNMSGVREHLGYVADDLKGFEHDRIAEEIAGINTMRG